MNFIQKANNGKLMTSLPDPQRHFKFGNFIKTQFSTKNDSFHHLSEQISTFIHRKAKRTFGKNMIATGHITAVAKMNPSYLRGGANVRKSLKTHIKHDTPPQ